MNYLPIRVQLKRTRGWRKPDNTVVVSRPSFWGNRFRIGCLYFMDTPNPVQVKDASHAVELYRKYPDHEPEWIRAALRGKNLGCWCPLWICPLGHTFGNEVGPSRVPKYCPHCSRPLLRHPCHADVLLEIANS